MGSNKHRRLGALVSPQGPRGQGQVRGAHLQGAHHQGAHHQGAHHQGAKDLPGANVREIPMLSMFLQRLHQHHYFPPIRVGHITYVC